VYGNASLTLSADRAPSSECGMFGLRAIRQSPGSGRHGELFLQEIGIGWRTIGPMPLRQRGWAFQERFLSPRRIHYFDEQMAWECRAGIFLKEHHSCLVPDGHFAQFLFKGRKEHDDTVYPVNGKNSKRQPTYSMLNATFRVQSWNECVREWSYRKFTKELDRLLSLSGLARAAEAPEMGMY
jgi:hypothetical protein